MRRTERTAARRPRRTGRTAAGMLALLFTGAVLTATARAPESALAEAAPARSGTLASAPAMAEAVHTGSAAAREIVVGAGHPIDRLSDALRQARDGDRIIVEAGVYAEGTLVIDRRIELVGRAGAVIDGAGAGHVLRVTADGVVLRGLTIRGAAPSMVRDHAAILFEDVSGCVAEGNRLVDNFFGIYLARTTGCRIADNSITASNDRESTSGNGIHLWSSADAVVEGNRIRGHRDGIYLEHVRGAALRGNTSEQNLRYGLHFMFSSENEYVGNEFRSNGAGVAVMYSKHVLIRDNTFADNWGPTAYGLLAKEISDSRIVGNRFVRNTTGLSSEGSMRVEVARNRFTGNGWAARVMANSQENRFVDNNFIDNSFDVTTNSRRNFNTFEGNYWSRYTGYDLDGDGIGDVPHRPVRLFALLVERTPVALALLRSPFVDLLEVAERVAPVLTPETLVDERPRTREVGP